jgi:hypothetical protein
VGLWSVRGRVAAGLVGLVVVAGSLVAIGVAPAGATTVTDEASFRAAWTNAAETQIDLANDVTFTTPCASTATRSSTTPLTVNGNGHTLTLCTNAGAGVLEQTNTGALTFQNVTVTGGTATGGFGFGGAIAAVGAVTVTNSTFTTNTAGGGGAIFGSGAVTVAYSTLTGNVAPTGSAVDASITLFGSVFVKPAGTGSLCSGTATSSGYNFANETANSCALTATGDSSLDANNPLLGGLAANGGPTQTQLPQTGSPLIDAIPTAACQTAPLATGITTDQRGLPRPDAASPNCDIGAVEVQLPALAPTAPLVVTPRFTG